MAILRTIVFITLTEKKTDVNIASDMLSAAFLGQCEQVVKLEAMAQTQLPNKIPGTSITKPGKW